MAVVTMRELLDSGVHFGHQTRRWNPNGVDPWRRKSSRQRCLRCRSRIRISAGRTSRAGRPRASRPGQGPPVIEFFSSDESAMGVST